MRYLILLLLAFPAHAEWDATERWLGTAAVTTLAFDWGQTRTTAKQPNLYYETNPILGRHPSTGQVDLYFVTCIIGTMLIADWLAPANRKLFLGTVTALEIVVIQRNRQIGIKVAF